MTRAVQAAGPVLDTPTERLCAGIASGEQTDVRLAVMAPGQFGKTAFLDHLEAECAHGGVRVKRFEHARGRDFDEDILVLVDDAHLLDETALAELLRMAGDERLGLVVAARPRPRPPMLNQVLGRLRSQVVLRQLDAAQVETHLSAVSGNRVARGFAEFVHAQTGGVPGLVHRLAVATDPRWLAEHPRQREHPEHPEWPETTLAELRHLLDQVDAGTLRLLIATDAGAGGDLERLCGVLELDADGVTALIESARATGLLAPTGAPVPVVSSALRSLVPVERQLAVRERMAESQLARRAPVLEMVRPWLGSGPAGAGLARAFHAAAEEALPTDPALAMRLFDASVTAGTQALEVGARRAEAVARSGDLDAALRLADEVIANPRARDRADAARVAATAMAHRGRLERSAELLRWSGSGQARPFAVVGLIASGRLADARQLLTESTVDEPPTLLSGALASMARGVLDSVTGSPTGALSTLVSATEMLEPVGHDLLLPDSPAALTAVLAVHGGEPTVAEPLLEHALSARTGGLPLVSRHQLLLAWIAMIRGDTTLATQRLAAVGNDPQPRDWLFAVALRVGLARRTGDLAALRRIWGQACEAVIRHPVDLFTFLPIGEFAVAAARLGERARLQPHLARAHELLDALDNPPLWSSPLHWSGLHAAIIGERTAEAEQHAAALHASAGHGPYHATMSAAAACWLKVIAGKIDPDEVEAAARGLRDSGARWDGARLAGQAAIRTSDRAAMLTLLDCARTLQGAPAATAEGAGSESASGTVRLSERELQVARLVVDGLTYKEVGAQLYISAKTVEHHMARIRQRLGAEGRGELLSQLRALLSDRPHDASA